MNKIDELRALLAKATPGPWHVDGMNDVSARDEHTCDPFVLAEIRRASCETDAALIVAAVNALPALLDVAEAAEIVVAGFRRPQAVAPERWYAAMETMRAALARLAE